LYVIFNVKFKKKYPILYLILLISCLAIFLLSLKIYIDFFTLELDDLGCILKMMHVGGSNTGGGSNGNGGSGGSNGPPGNGPPGNGKIPYEFIQTSSSKKKKAKVRGRARLMESQNPEAPDPITNVFPPSHPNPGVRRSDRYLFSETR
jgi:hypothetical protein